MAIGKEELMHEFLLYSCMGTARMKQDKETKEEGKKKGVNMERSKAEVKKRSPNGISHPNQNTIIINIILKYLIRNEKSIIKFN